MLDLFLKSGIMKLSAREQHQKKTERRKEKMFTFENYLNYCELNNLEPSHYENLQEFKRILTDLQII